VGPRPPGRPSAADYARLLVALRLRPEGGGTPRRGLYKRKQHQEQKPTQETPTDRGLKLDKIRLKTSIELRGQSGRPADEPLEKISACSGNNPSAVRERPIFHRPLALETPAEFV